MTFVFKEDYLFKKHPRLKQSLNDIDIHDCKIFRHDEKSWSATRIDFKKRKIVFNDFYVAVEQSASMFAIELNCKHITGYTPESVFYSVTKMGIDSRMMTITTSYNFAKFKKHYMYKIVKNNLLF